MNKYQEAFERTKEVVTADKVDDFITLKELVEKTTPKKPLDVCTPVVKWGLCPVCKGELNKLGGKPNRVFSNQKYCPDCGQALDWSEEE